MFKFHLVVYLKNNDNEKDFNLLFFSDFPASEIYVPTFRNTVCSIFICLVNKKNNLDKIPRVFYR